MSDGLIFIFGLIAFTSAVGPLMYAAYLDLTEGKRTVDKP